MFPDSCFLLILKYNFSNYENKNKKAYNRRKKDKNRALLALYDTDDSCKKSQDTGSCYKNSCNSENRAAEKCFAAHLAGRHEVLHYHEQYKEKDN